MAIFNSYVKLPEGIMTHDDIWSQSSPHAKYAKWLKAISQDTTHSGASHAKWLKAAKIRWIACATMSLGKPQGSLGKCCQQRWQFGHQSLQLSFLSWLHSLMGAGWFLALELALSLSLPPSLHPFRRLNRYTHTHIYIYIYIDNQHTHIYVYMYIIIIHLNKCINMIHYIYTFCR